jgi:predicted PurR-regulated permease PerM
MVQMAPIANTSGSGRERPPIPAQVTLLAFIATVAGLYLAREVLIPLTIAVLLSIVLAPLVSMLRRLKLGRIPAVLLAVVVSIGLICVVGGVIGTQMANLAEEIPTYAQTIEKKVDTVRGYALDRLGEVATRFGYSPTAPAGPNPGKTLPQTRLPPAPLKEGPKPLSVEVHQPDPSPIDLVERYLSPVLSPLGSVAIVFVVTIFVLLQQDDLRDRLIRLVGSGDLRRTTTALDDGGRRLARYFVTQLAINSGFGVVVAVGLLLIGVPSPLLWGVLAGLLRFVPYIGAVIAALFPMALAAAIDPGWSTALWTGGLFLVSEGLTGQMVEPLLYGRNTGLAPISVVVAAIFWSWLWGPVGLILSTPLTLCLVVLGRHVEQLEFLDVMLGDRAPLTPVETFYHRMLAADQDEARDHAERLLKERSLTAYYDEVALPGLELAAVDWQSGTLSTEQLDRIKETIKDLVEELAAHLDREPAPRAPKDPAGIPQDEAALQSERPPARFDLARHAVSGAWAAPAPVLCVAGRGALDEAAASMLSQLLTKHGIGSRIASSDMVTRDNIGSLDTDDVAIVCISYLDITGKHAHLRYLLQRLRQRLPGAPIIVGLWPRESPAMPDPGTQSYIGADHYARTLKDAVEICVGLARTACHDARSPETRRVAR